MNCKDYINLTPYKEVDLLVILFSTVLSFVQSYSLEVRGGLIYLHICSIAAYCQGEFSRMIGSIHNVDYYLLRFISHESLVAVYAHMYDKILITN